MLTTKTPTSVLLLSLCIACVVIFRVTEIVSSKTESPASNDTPVTIAPGSSTQRTLAAGARQVFAISAETGKLLRFSIDKGDLGLSTTLFDPNGNRLLEHISQDFEDVEISFPIQFAGTYTIALQSREKEAEPRQFELKVETLTTVTAAGRKDSEARQALAQAEVLRASWTKASLRQSTELFDKAAAIWKSLGDFSNASRAMLKSGDAYFHLSQNREALKRCQDALDLGTKKGDALAEARALSQLARLNSYAGDNDVAQQHLTRALALLTDSTPATRNAHGEALTILGELVHARGNFTKARAHFEAALKLLEGDRNGQARVHLFIGYINGSIGNTEKGRAEISQALALYQATNDKIGEGQALSALGIFRSAIGEHDAAIELHKSAREIFRTVGDRHSEGIANNALGQAYERLNQPDLALHHYQQALGLFEDVGAMNGVAPTNCLVAHAHFLSDRLEQALTYYQRCLDLSRIAGMIRVEVSALNEIASVYVRQHRYELALAQHQRVQKFYKSINDRRGLARALIVYGDLLLQAGQKQPALDTYERALQLSKQSGEQDTQLMALYGLAHTNLANGAPEVALSFIQQSLSIIEDLRSNVAAPEFRTSYFSGVQQHYELCIETLAQLERLQPGKGFAAQALLVRERSRARLLYDLVNESRASIRAGASKELIDEERELRGLIRAQAEYRMSLGSNPKDPAETAEAQEQLDQLKAEYQRVEARLRQENPYLASLEQFEPLSVEQIQKDLGADTILLEFSLGEERSYLWLVTSDSLQLYDLPQRRHIEDPVREYLPLLTARQETGGPATGDYRARITAAEDALPGKGRALSEMLLGQVAENSVTNGWSWCWTEHCRTFLSRRYHRCLRRTKLR